VTTFVLATIALLAAAALIGVTWSLVKATRTETEHARLRRDGVRATGTVLDNTMTSTPQRRLLFSPVVEFHSRDGHTVEAAAQQVSATSWPRGATVEVAYDPADPARFVLAGPPERAHLVANAVIGIVVVGLLAGTMVVTYQIWDQFRHDRGGQPQPTSTVPADVAPTG
jgi:hypothetical protein